MLNLLTWGRPSGVALAHAIHKAVVVFVESAFKHGYG
jgi:hypothetical protein